jgi:hypothetical protein
MFWLLWVFTGLRAWFDAAGDCVFSEDMEISVRRAHACREWILAP